MTLPLQDARVDTQVGRSKIHEIVLHGIACVLRLPEAELAFVARGRITLLESVVGPADRRDYPSFAA